MLAVTETKPAAEGSKPFRFILRLRPRDTHTPFVVHMQTMDNNAMMMGMYSKSLADALGTLQKRASRENLEILDYAKHQ